MHRGPSRRCVEHERCAEISQKSSLFQLVGIREARDALSPSCAGAIFSISGTELEANMGLMDVLNGMQNGPRGQPMPSGSSGGMSPITMAILGLIAYKAIKGMSGTQPGAAPAAPMPGGGAAGGGLGGLLSGTLGSLLGGAGAGSVVSGGLNDLVRQLQQNGHDNAVNSWVGHGPNQAISPNDLEKALGADQINALTSHTGMTRDQLLAGLSQELPQAVDELTPDGRVPSAQEVTNRVS
jgi:uncharacterized protein YidB (DUF937 family)